MIEKKIMKYTLIQDWSLDSLNNRVQKFINSGYEPYGAPIVLFTPVTVDSPLFDTFYCQAMVQKGV